MKYIILALMLYVPFLKADSNVSEKIKLHDIAIYHADEKGLKEFSVKVEVQGLLKDLNAQKNYGKLSELYFILHWQAPNQTEVEVYGLGESFADLKEQLKIYALSIVDYIVARNLEEQLSGYDLKLLKNNNQEQIMATDLSGMKEANELKLTFNTLGLVGSLFSQKSQGTDEISYNYEKPTSTNNKAVITKITNDSKKLNMNSQVETVIEYSSIEGYTLPTKVITKTKFQAHGQSKGQLKDSEMTILISDYKINTGSTKRIFNK